MMLEAPIQNLDKLDIVGERNDGGVDLIIVASGPLDGSSEVLLLLETKVKNYINELSKPSFKAKFGDANIKKCSIYVVCEYAIDERIIELIDQLKILANSSGAELAIRHSEDWGNQQGQSRFFFKSCEGKVFN